MRSCDCAFLLTTIVLLQIVVKGDSNINNTIFIQQPNITQITQLKTLNSTKESQNKANKTNNDEMTKMPLRIKEEPVKEQEGQNGKLSSDSYIEECDPSNRCEDEKKRFTACLRVPGTDSLALSLLIENRGIDSLNIDIFAPDFVNLEQSKVELKSKEHKEVKVSLYKDSNNTKILLKSQESKCILSLPNTLSLEPSRNFYSHLGTSSLIIFIPIIILILLIFTYLCIKFRKNNHEAEKMEELLPISTGGREICKNDPEKWICEKDPEKWDNNNWGDNWDDEEAPLTPSKPFLKKDLYKGLASRKFNNKDGWKD